MILICSNIWELLDWMTLGPILKQSMPSNALQGCIAFFFKSPVCSYRESVHTSGWLKVLRLAWLGSFFNMPGTCCHRVAGYKIPAFRRVVVSTTIKMCPLRTRLYKPGSLLCEPVLSQRKGWSTDLLHFFFSCNFQHVNVQFWSQKQTKNFFCGSS